MVSPEPVLRRIRGMSGAMGEGREGRRGSRGFSRVVRGGFCEARIAGVPEEGINFTNVELV